jgi:hypothetical protein
MDQEKVSKGLNRRRKIENRLTPLRFYLGEGGLTRSKGILAKGSEVGGFVASMIMREPRRCQAVRPGLTTSGKELSRV